MITKLMPKTLGTTDNNLEKKKPYQAKLASSNKQLKDNFQKIPLSSEVNFSGKHAKKLKKVRKLLDFYREKWESTESLKKLKKKLSAAIIESDFD